MRVYWRMSKKRSHEAGSPELELALEGLRRSGYVLVLR